MDSKQIKKAKMYAIQAIMAKSNGNVLLNSEHGVKLLKNELIYLFSTIDQMVNQQLEDDYRKIGEVVIQRRHCTVTGGKLAVQLQWESKFKNSLEGSLLWVNLLRGNPIKKERMWIKKKKLIEIEKKKFVFQLTQKGECGWKEIAQEANGAHLKSEQLANMAIRMLLDAMQQGKT